MYMFKEHVMPTLPPLAYEALQNSIMLTPSRDNDVVDAIVLSLDKFGKFELIVVPASGVPDLHSVDILNQYTIMLTESTLMFSASDPSKFVGYRIANDTISNPSLVYMFMLGSATGTVGLSSFLIRKYEQTEAQVRALLTSSAAGIKVEAQSYLEPETGNTIIGCVYGDSVMEGHPETTVQAMGQFGFGYSANLNAAFTPRFAALMLINDTEGGTTLELRCFKNFDVPKYIDFTFAAPANAASNLVVPSNGRLNTHTAMYTSTETVRIYTWTDFSLTGVYGDIETSTMLNSIAALFNSAYDRANVLMYMSVPLLGIDTKNKDYTKDGTIGWLHTDTKELAAVDSLYYAGGAIYDVEVTPVGNVVVVVNNIDKHTNIDNSSSTTQFGNVTLVDNTNNNRNINEITYNFGSSISLVNPTNSADIYVDTPEDRILVLENKVLALGAIVDKLLTAVCTGDSAELCQTTWTFDPTTPDVLVPVGTTDVTTGTDGTDGVTPPDTTGGGLDISDILVDIKRTTGIPIGCNLVGIGGPDGIDKNSPGVGSPEGSVVWNYNPQVLDNSIKAIRKNNMWEVPAPSQSTRFAAPYGLSTNSYSHTLYIFPQGSESYEREFERIDGRPTLVIAISAWLTPKPIEDIVFHLRYTATGYKTHDIYVHTFSTRNLGPNTRTNLGGEMFIALPVPFDEGITYNIEHLETLFVKNELSGPGLVYDYPKLGGVGEPNGAISLTSEGRRNCYSEQRGNMS